MKASDIKKMEALDKLYKKAADLFDSLTESLEAVHATAEHIRAHAGLREDHGDGGEDLPRQVEGGKGDER